MKRLLLIVSILLSMQINAQQQLSAPDTTVYSVVDTMPQYPGGPGAMMKYLSTHTGHVTMSCLLPKIYMQFVIDKEGKVQHPKASVREDSDCKELSDYLQSIENMLAAMPPWFPGKQNGMPVNVRLQLPLFICMKGQ